MRFSKSLNSELRMSNLLTNSYIFTFYLLDYYYRIYPKGNEENLHEYDYIPIRVQSGALGPHLENLPQQNHVQSNPRGWPGPGTHRHQLHRLKHLNQRLLQQRSRTADQPLQVVWQFGLYAQRSGDEKFQQAEEASCARQRWQQWLWLGNTFCDWKHFSETWWNNWTQSVAQCRVWGGVKWNSLACRLPRVNHTSNCKKVRHSNIFKMN